MSFTLPTASELSAALNDFREWAQHQTISFPSRGQFRKAAPLKTPLRLAQANEEKLSDLKQEAQTQTSPAGINEPRCVAELPKKDPNAPTMLLYSATEQNGICYVKFDTPRGEATIGAQTIGYVSRSSIIAFENSRDWLSRQLESARRQNPITPIEPLRYNGEMIQHTFGYLGNSYYSEMTSRTLVRGTWLTLVPAKF